MIRVAKYILHDRNTVRALVVSRQDNNEMWEIGWTLEQIANRIEDGYKNQKH